MTGDTETPGICSEYPAIASGQTTFTNFHSANTRKNVF